MQASVYNDTLDDDNDAVTATAPSRGAYNDVDATYDDVGATYDDNDDKNDASVTAATAADAHEQHTIDDETAMDDDDDDDDVASQPQQEQQHDADDMTSAFSFHRVKELLKLYTRLSDKADDDDVRGDNNNDRHTTTVLVARDAVSATSEAVALLVRDFVRLAAAETARRGHRTVTYDDVARVVQLYDRYAFLADVLPPSAPPTHATRSHAQQQQQHTRASKQQQQQHVTTATQPPQQSTLRQLTLPF